MKRLILTTIFATAFSLATSPADEAGDWVSLFDGQSLAGWEKGNGQPAELGGWVIEDNALHRQSGGGDLYTVQEYGDFEFSFEWKISPKGNSGVKYRVTKYGNSYLGPEYQVLDNEHSDGKNNVKRQAASLYDLKAVNENAVLKPVGEWNESRIVAKGLHFQHFLNGELVLEAIVDSDEWKEIFEQSKFKKTADFAHNPKGKIMLQDHGDKVWFRNLKIRELK